MTSSGQDGTLNLGNELGDHFGYLATYLAIFEDFQKCDYFLDISIRSRDPDFSRDFHVTSWPVRETINRRCSNHRGESSLDFERVDRLGTSSEREVLLWSLVRIASWSDAEQYCSCYYCYY
ncbi:hypothetical protein AVEN_246970-1 [Araneus ventricosus]|uniref:Uncharacterized protein n=1 Tax=Araneus ventricosus TaxID=182803 RepID=A0A4Y2IV15_ARAVE|nr:hypothetical protein AVEN_246970-1 [Araneus ventricosus]